MSEEAPAPTPNWIIATYRWMRKNLLAATAVIAFAFTVANYYEQLGLPMLATTKYVDSSFQRTMNNIGIDTREFPNIKNYIDRKDLEVQSELLGRLHNLENQNIRLLSQVEIILEMYKEDRQARDK